MTHKGFGMNMILRVKRELLGVSHLVQKEISVLP